MSLKVVYLAMSLGSAPHKTKVSWNPNNPCAHRYIEGTKHEGPFLMLAELKKRKIIDEIMMFYESNRGPGYADWGYGISGYVCPQLPWIDQFIDDDTIIYVRGGFKGWYDWLMDRKRNNQWIMCYNANTGRERWTFWDIVLWDLNDENINYADRHGRFWYYYLKPIDEKTFFPIRQEPFYDICIGASHIHDKKGQWRVIDALIQYKKMYGINLKAILPGYGVRGTQTHQIRSKILKHNLDVTITGMLKRQDLNRTVYNRSKIFVHLGTHGQNDRGPLEALACGVPLIIGSPRYHAPLVYRDSMVCTIPKDINNSASIAETMRNAVETWTPSIRDYVREWYEDQMSFDNKCLPNIKNIFEFMRLYPKATEEGKREFERCFTNA